MIIKKIAVIFLELFVISVLVIGVGKINFENGKIAMCRELGGEMTADENKCINAEELFNPANPVQTINIEYMGFKNGTIL